MDTRYTTDIHSAELYRSVAEGTFQKESNTVLGIAYHPGYLDRSTAMAVREVGEAQETIEGFMQIADDHNGRPLDHADISAVELFNDREVDAQIYRVRRALKALCRTGLVRREMVRRDTGRMAAQYTVEPDTFGLDHQQPLYPARRGRKIAALVGATTATIAGSVIEGKTGWSPWVAVESVAAGAVAIASTIRLTPGVNAVRAQWFYRRESSLLAPE